MKNKNLIRKTEHCLLRQWERDIPDNLLNKVVQCIPFIKKGKNGYIVGETTRTRLGVPKNNLFVLMDYRTIVTVFYIEDLPVFMFVHKTDASVQII